MCSIFEWQGKIEEAHEAGMFIKTRHTLVDELMAEAKNCHPYDVPALLVIPIEAGNAEYLSWLGDNTKSAGS